MSFEDYLKNVKDYLSKDKVKLLNMGRIEEIADAYNTLRMIMMMDEEDTTIEIKEDALELGDISIKVVIPEFTVHDILLFTKAISKADIVDIYPTADERLHIDITFRNAYLVTVLE